MTLSLDFNLEKHRGMMDCLKLLTDGLDLDTVLTVLPSTFFTCVLLTVVALPEVISIAFKRLATLVFCL